MTTTSQYTTGIMSATVSGSDSGEFKATEELLIKMEQNFVHISGQEKDPDNVTNKWSAVFGISPDALPGNGVETVFSLGTTIGPTMASAAFTYRDSLYPAKKGALTIRYVESDKRLIGTFEFSTVSSGVSFELTEGAFDLVGVLESGVNRVQTFSADLEDIPAKKFEAESST